MADLDALNRQILSNYKLFAAAKPGMHCGWIKKSLLFEDLYLISYLYAALVACKLYGMDKGYPASF